MIKLIFGSKNKNKLIELQKLFAEEGVENINLVTAPEDCVDPIEDGKTFKENACIKAKAYAEYVIGSSLYDACSEVYLLAEDSGFCIDALDNGPGIYSSRLYDIKWDGSKFSEPQGKPKPENSDVLNNEILLNLMEGVKNRKSHFMSSMAMVCVRSKSYSSGELMTCVEGKAEGFVSDKIISEQGWAYGHLFYMIDENGVKHHWGRISPEEKGKMSHRAAALKKLCKFLLSL